MSDGASERARDLFHRAVSLPAPARSEFLDRECGGDPDLRRAVEALLASERPTAAPRPGGAGAPPPGSSAAIMGGPADEPGDDRIGPYRILEKLGEGGMGIVYLAERSEPIQQRVALKIIKPGMDSKAVIARFEAEREALARMDHPNIAKVLDAGMTARGLPYFVMEYVKGEPITAHADRARLSVEERLELLIAVCEAVQHAHHKGVIHRDLKPSNILVAQEGSVRTPKVIDFGVARATDQSIADGAFTRHGDLIGTLEYMSPEQAEMSAQDIDTRTDVYALGVVLYELLTGVLPFDSEELRRAGIDAMQRTIRDVEPVVPSRRLRTLSPGSGSTAGDISRARGVDSKHLSRLLRNDLDWVVMKCLEKRRERRYDTPSALALDLRRFLAGQTVLTGPPSLTYHFGKFVRRHRGPIAAGAAVLVTLIAGLVATAVEWRRAERREAEIRAVATTLIDEFHGVVASLPGSLAARETFVSLGADLLERRLERAGDDEAALEAIATGYDLLGDAEAGLRTPHRGDLSRALGLYERARAVRERLPRGPEALVGLAESDLRIGDVRREQERLDESIAAYRRGLTFLDRLPDGPSRAAANTTLRATILVALANAIGRLDEPADPEERLDLLVEAERLLAPLAASDPTDDVREAYARVLHNLADRRRESGDTSSAHALYARAAALRRSLFEADPVDAHRRRQLAASLLLSGLTQTDEAQRAESLAAARRHFEFLVEADPSDVEARRRLSRALGFIAQIEPDPGRSADLMRRAVDEARGAIALAPGTAAARFETAQLEGALAGRLRGLDRPAEAAAMAASAYRRMDEFLRATRGQEVAALRGILTVTNVEIQALSARETPPARWADLSDRLRATAGWLRSEAGRLGGLAENGATRLEALAARSDEAVASARADEGP